MAVFSNPEADTGRAFTYLDSLARSGDGRALRWRGMLEERRRRGPEAGAFYRRAIAAGDTSAYAPLAFIYDPGRHGRPARPDSFIAILGRAERRGVVSAGRLLSRYHRNLDGGVARGETTAVRIDRELRAAGLRPLAGQP